METSFHCIFLSSPFSNDDSGTVLNNVPHFKCDLTSHISNAPWMFLDFNSEYFGGLICAGTGIFFWLRALLFFKLFTSFILLGVHWCDYLVTWQKGTCSHWPANVCYWSYPSEYFQYVTEHSAWCFSKLPHSFLHLEILKTTLFHCSLSREGAMYSDINRK